MPAITEFDIVFISYDEPTAEKHWADLLAKAPWAKRVHGVKGFDAAHRTAAEQAETEWFITVDADNIVRREFFDLMVEPTNDCLSWRGLNGVNGLAYGNGGIKFWKRSYVYSMNSHENATDPRKAVDFCWERGYKHMDGIYSDVWSNGSPFQAFRAGFREGVKLSLDRGERVSAETMKLRLHPENLRNLKVWCCIGAHMENGLWGIYGARLAWLMMCDLSWHHIHVRDYDWFTNFYRTELPFNPNVDRLAMQSQMGLALQCESLGTQLYDKTKIAIPLLNSAQSNFMQSIFQ